MKLNKLKIKFKINWKNNLVKLLQAPIKLNKKFKELNNNNLMTF